MSETVRAPLVEALRALTDWLNAIAAPAIVIGGVAASLLGRPRFTQDVDALAVLPEAAWPQALTRAPAFDLVVRVENPLDLARKARVLLLRHVPTHIDVDVVLGALPFEAEAVEHGVEVQLEGIAIRLPRVEDLLIMKAIAHRPRDLDDIEALLAANTAVDLGRVRGWVAEFARAATMPELIADLERLIGRSEKPPS